MAQQNLQTIVSIGGRVDNTFGMIGESLIGLGSQIDMISQKIIDFGKESVEEYVNYDDLMREVKAVGEFTDAEIASLDAINSQIAKTTVYSNAQAAEAEVLMGQYGMLIPEIKEMLPSTLELAMAGNISIANSVDYLYSTLKSLGLGMEYADELTDQMAKTAAIGATDIDTLGDSLTRLGSGAQMFKGGSVEILAILSAMSQFGEDQRGSIAGTWIRNFMLSLTAPMGELDDIIDAMEQLGATQDEIDEYVGGKSSGIAAQAVDSLMEAGLRIYDESGNLLPAIDIIKSLRDAVRGSGDYADDLNELSAAYNAAGGDVEAFLASTDGLTDNALYNIFRRIFGRRGVTTALNLISISDAEWEDTIGEIMNSEGFAESMAETMQGGLGGALRELEATFTEFETTIGGILAPSVEGVAGFLKDIVLSLDNMDEGTLEALINGIGVIGIAGPALLTTGLAFRLIGYALTPAGAIGLGVIGLAALAVTIGKLRDASINNNFGTMALDLDTLGTYVSSLGTDFETSYGQINEFSGALDGAVTAYTDASSSLASNLLTDMLTGVTLTEDDKAYLLGLGDEMGKQLTEGIWLSTATSMSNITLLFGGEGVAEYDEDYQTLIGALDSAREDMLANAAGLSQGLREELLSAFEDGEISDEEYAKIKEWFEAYNEAVAQIARDIQNEEDAIALQVLLHKGQTASYEDAQEYGNQILSARDEKLTALEDQYLHDYYASKIALDQELVDLQESDATEQEIKDKKEKNTAALAALEAEYRTKAAEVSAPYDSAYALLWDTTLRESDLGEAYGYLQTLMDGVTQHLYSMEGAMALFDDRYGRGSLWAPGEAEAIAIVTDPAVEAAGGYEQASKNPILQDLSLANVIAGGTAGDAEDFYGGMIDDVMATGLTVEKALKSISELGLGGTWEGVGTIIATNFGLELTSVLHNLDPSMQIEFTRIVDRLNELYDLEAVRAQMPEGTPDGSQGKAFAAWWLLYGDASANAQDYLRIPTPQPEPEPAEFDPNDYAIEEPIEVPLEPDLSEGAVQVEIDNAQLFLNQQPGYWTINPVLQNIDLGTPQLPGFPGFADGGRATEPSIFGEAGAEWAIPEEHSQRTADLLSAAAEASGFTWPELIDRNGGLNAAPDRTPRQLIYSPTIYANDARGVKEALAEDKDRMMRMLKDMQDEQSLRDEIEVFQ